MATLSSSGVTTVRTWHEGYAFRRRTCKLVRAVLDTAGDAATIPASAFGLTEIEEVGTMVKSDGSLVYYAAPNYARDAILIPGVANATAANHGTPAAISGTFQFIVKGR